MDLAVWASIFVASFVAIFLSMTSRGDGKEAHDKARARRIAEARMNARLLRLNI